MHGFGSKDKVAMREGIWFIAFMILVSTSATAATPCRKIGEVCVAPNQTQNIEGMSIFRECWEYKATYDCRSESTVNDCKQLRDQGCTQLGSMCVERNSAGTCILREENYQCPDRAEAITERTVCDQTAFCLDDGTTCFDTQRASDGDFAKAVAMTEAAREAGVYGFDSNALNIFKGYKEQCTVKVLGGAELKSCCKSSGGGQNFTNNALIETGSKYVFDALYHQVDSSLVQKGAESAGNWAMGSGGSLGMYGFTFEFSMANGLQFVGFDPASFAFSVGLMMAQKWLQCDGDEQVLSMKRGQNLCVYVGSYCSRKILGTCLEKEQQYCCFNSKLAKLINRQGRSQLGLSLSDCGGFSQEQLEALDFSTMNFSEFMADVAPKTPNLIPMAGQVQETVQQKVKDYYTR